MLAVKNKTQLKEVYRLDDNSKLGWNSFLKLGKNEDFQEKIDEIKNKLWYLRKYQRYYRILIT